MTMLLSDLQTAAVIEVLASEVLQDIWAHHHNIPPNATKTRAEAHGQRGGHPGYTELRKRRRVQER
jgi:hypothetical protein